MISGTLELPVNLRGERGIFLTDIFLVSAMHIHITCPRETVFYGGENPLTFFSSFPHCFSSPVPHSTLEICEMRLYIVTIITMYLTTWRG